MGFFDFLVGSKPEVRTQTKATTSPEQEFVAHDLKNFFARNIRGGNTDFGIDPNFVLARGQNLSLDSLSGLSDLIARADAGFGEASESLEGAPTARSLLGETDLGFENQTTPTGEFLKRVFEEEGDVTDIDQFFTDAVEAPLLQNFQERILPAISRRQGLEGFTTSGRVEGDIRAREDLLDALTAERSRTAFNAREAARGRRLSAAGGIDQLSAAAGESAIDRALSAALAEFGADVDIAQGDADRATNRALGLADIESSRLGSISNAIGVQGAIANDIAGFEERNLDREISLRLAEAGIDQRTIDQMLAFINSNLRENIVLNKPGTEGILPSLIKAGGDLGAAKILASDRRLKHIQNVVWSVYHLDPVGARKKIRVYSYQWNDLAKKSLSLEGEGIGPIAQEVQEVRPDLVTEGSDGFLRVDCDRLYGELV